MSEFKFMQYGDLAVAEELTETAHVLVEEDGGIKRYPANSFASTADVSTMIEEALGVIENGTY